MKKYIHSNNKWNRFILNDGSTFIIKNNMRLRVYFTENDISSNILWSFKNKEILNNEQSKRIIYEL